MDKNILAKKKAFLMLACIWFIISFSVIQTTYAKYVTNLDANANITISYWNIIVNDIDISNQTDISEKLTSVLPGSDYAKPNVIVPGATGYFNLNIDSSKVTVPFSVTVKSSINATSSLTTDFVVSGYSLDGGTTIVDLTSADDVSQDATPDTTTFSINIAADVDNTILTVYTTWLDDGLDSKEDTDLGISGGTAILDVKLSFEHIT